MFISWSPLDSLYITWPLFHQHCPKIHSIRFLFPELYLAIYYGRINEDIGFSSLFLSPSFFLFCMMVSISSLRWISLNSQEEGLLSSRQRQQSLESLVSRKRVKVTSQSVSTVMRIAASVWQDSVYRCDGPIGSLFGGGKWTWNGAIWKGWHEFPGASWEPRGWGRHSPRPVWHWREWLIGWSAACTRRSGAGSSASVDEQQ